MSRGGMTLVEVALALALFSGIFLGLADLAATSGQLSKRVPDARTRSEMARFALAVDRALFEGDDPAAQDRIEASPNLLRIRGWQEAWRQWSLHSSGALIEAGDPAPVLTGVREFKPHLDLEAGRLRILIEIEAPRGGVQRLEWEFPLP